MQITPFVIGSGRSAQALTESLRILEITTPGLTVAPLRKIARGESLAGLPGDAENPILLIANPHGLHAKSILEAERAGFKLIVTEKPAVVSSSEIESLAKVSVPVAVCHGYRQMWGIQTLRQKIAAGDFGQIIAIEGRYWQSSAAQAALAGVKSSSWKNDPALGGKHDALIDIASHWVDAATFLLGEVPTSSHQWLSYVNAESAHRDTHVQLNFDFASKARAMASISKTVHGAGNHFEVNVIGQKQYASWLFASPDQIEIGVGNERRFVSRTAKDNLGSGHPPFHGTGWLEGYIEILRQAIGGLSGAKATYPTLAQHLAVMRCLLNPST